MSEKLFKALGFRWNRAAIPAPVPTFSIERVCFHYHRMLPEFVWDASVLEGNPLTFPEIMTLLDGIAVGGHKLSDQDRALNLVAKSKRLLALVKLNEFRLDKTTFCSIHAF